MIRLSGEQRREIERHGEETYPHECCGFLLGTRDGGDKHVLEVRRARNVRDDSPQNRYMIEPREIYQTDRDASARGLEILGFYHSHPNVAARPSDFDLEQACPWYTYVIVSVRAGKAAEMNAWVIPDIGGPFEQEPIEDTESGANA